MERYPDAYVEFLVHYHGTRDYFECHEIMEEYWKQETNSLQRKAWLALIKSAVAAYHERRGNTAGAAKMWDSALRNVRDRESVFSLGLDRDAYERLLSERLASCTEARHTAFRDPNLPITDESLLERCIIRCGELGVSWGAPSTNDPELIHKHTRRDRADVINERERQKQLKHDSRGKETT